MCLKLLLSLLLLLLLLYCFETMMRFRDVQPWFHAYVAMYVSSSLSSSIVKRLLFPSCTLSCCSADSVFIVDVVLDV